MRSTWVSFGTCLSLIALMGPTSPALMAQSGNEVADYNVAFSAFRIRNTRSRHQDTVWIAIKVFVDGVVKGTSTWDGSGHGSRDFNNGYYDGLRNAGGQIVGAATGPITDASKVTFSFIVTNAGYTPSEENYRKAFDAISRAAAAGGVVSPWSYVVGAIAKGASFFVGANCDGTVAADSITLTGKDIRERMAGHPYYNWTDKDGYVIHNTPAGCGSDPNYSVVVQFTHH